MSKSKQESTVKQRVWTVVCGMVLVSMVGAVGCRSAYAQGEEGSPSSSSTTTTQQELGDTSQSDGVSGDGQQGGGVLDDAQVPAVQPGDADVRKRVEYILSGYEYFPARADLDKIALAPQMTRVLLAMSVEQDISPMLSNRAVDALGYYHEDDVVAHLRTLALTDTDGLSRVELRAARSRRYHAIVSYAKAGGEVALGDLAQLMDHTDVQIQLSAISAIGKHMGEEGKVVLKERQAVEQDPLLLKELRKHVR